MPRLKNENAPLVAASEARKQVPPLRRAETHANDTSNGPESQACSSDIEETRALRQAVQSEADKNSALEERLKDVLDCLTGLSDFADSALMNIKNLANLSLVAMKCPDAYEEPELLAGCFKSIVLLAEDALSCCNNEASRQVERDPDVDWTDRFHASINARKKMAAEHIRLRAAL